LTKNKRRIGQEYEILAHQYLAKQGLSLIEKNFLTNGGELDLIMKDLDCIIFVEVRYRKSALFGHAAETVTASKRKNIVKAANTWLLKHGLSIHSTQIRFDVVAIHNNGQQIEWIKNAINQG
jgi:putative endonuclease